MQIHSPAPHRFIHAAIVHANTAQFMGGQKTTNPWVESRMVLWCKAGTGRIIFNGNHCEFEPGRYLVLGWGQAITYEASRDDPFLLAGVHIIPSHCASRPIAFDVAHAESHPLAHCPFRRDVNIPDLDGQLGSLDPNAPLTHLLEYIVGVFIRDTPEEWLSRQLAQQLLCELVRSKESSRAPHHGFSPEIERMKEFIVAYLHLPLSLQQLVEFARLSPSTVGRLFRKHLHTTPVDWIIRAKMERAQILLRMRRLSVAEIAGQVGITDPYYFSKCFKRIIGKSPLEYRKSVAWI